MNNLSVGPLLLLMLIGGSSFCGHCLQVLPPQHPGNLAGENEKTGHGSIISQEPLSEVAAKRREAVEMIYPQGSSLPDCSHACEACFPCKRVMVGFKCLVTESCPIVYRCMCKGKYYHVPSS